MAFRPTGYARLWRQLGLTETGAEDFFGHCWSTSPAAVITLDGSACGDASGAQRLGDWEEVNSCAKAAAELTTGAVQQLMKARLVAWLDGRRAWQRLSVCALIARCAEQALKPER